MRGDMLEGRVAHWVRVIGFVLGRRVVTAYGVWGLRTGAFTTMTLIADNPGISQSDIALGIGLDTSSIVAIVDELEQRGYARRSRSSTDRRRNSLQLTKEGEATMRAMYQAGFDAEEPLRAEFSEAELALFLEYLARAHGCLVAQGIPPSDDPPVVASTRGRARKSD